MRSTSKTLVRRNRPARPKGKGGSRMSSTKISGMRRIRLRMIMIRLYRVTGGCSVSSILSCLLCCKTARSTEHGRWEGVRLGGGARVVL